jgi:hypothetical protein
MINDIYAVHFPEEDHPEASSADCEAVAIRLLREATEHGQAGIQKHLAAAAALAEVKRKTPRRFRKWHVEEARISATLGARYLRLNNQKEDLPCAQAWARATNNPLAECYSLENLLRLIAAWRNRDGKPDKERKKSEENKRALISRAELELQLAEKDKVIADLERRLTEDDHEYRQLRDTIPPDVLEEAARLADESPEEFGALARRYHWRRRDLLEMCTGRHISEIPSSFPESTARGDGEMVPPRSPDCPNERPGVEDDQKTGTNAPSSRPLSSPVRFKTATSPVVSMARVSLARPTVVSMARPKMH